MRFKLISLCLILGACLFALLYAGLNWYDASDNHPTALTHNHPPPSLIVPTAPVVVRAGPPGELVAATIPLGNKGTKALLIEKVVPGCGCTLVDNKEAFSIAAGQTELL